MSRREFLLILLLALVIPTPALALTITLNSPPNYAQTLDTTPTFNFTPTGSSSSYNCTLCIDGTPGWWNYFWSYRKSITIDNTGNSNNLTDYQILIILNSTNFNFSKANSDGSDIRFIDDDNSTELNYYIEKWNSTNQEAKIWVKVPFIPASSTKTIYMYYGNPSASSESNGTATFVFFDDFEPSSNKWSGTGNYSTSGEGYVNATQHGSGTSNSTLVSEVIGSGDFKVTLKIKATGNAETNCSYEHKLIQVTDSGETVLDSNAYPSYTEKTYTVSGTNISLKLYVSATGNSTTSTLILRPNGPGDYANIQYVEPSGAEHWSVVDEAVANDSDYVYEGDEFANADVYALEDPSSQSGEIQEVKVCTRSDTTGEGSVKPRLRLGTDETYGSDLSYSSWTLNCQALARPGGGNWTWTDIANLQAGAELVAPVDHYAYLSQLYVEVYYGTLSNATAAMWVDDVKVYKYTSPEPSVSIGSEEEAGCDYKYEADNIPNNTAAEITPTSALSFGDHNWTISCQGVGTTETNTSETRVIGIGENFSRCAVLIDPGTYKLTGDIINSSTSHCIDIQANDVVLDCQNHLIDGDDAADYGIYIYRSSQQTTNITIKNCILKDWDGANIYLRYANGNTLTNITTYSSPDYGIYLDNSNSNTLSNITTNSNTNGIFLYYSDSNTIKNSKIYNNSNYGIYLLASDSNTITNITSYSNNYDGIYLRNSDSNTIKNSKIWNNSQYGINLLNSGIDTPNLIYNNIFNNTNNFYISSIFSTPNQWNVTKQEGNNIYDPSNPYIGGNLWAKPDGTGFSQTCNDTDKDGFCDDPYTLETDNVDYLPLKYIPIIFSNLTYPQHVDVDEGKAVIKIKVTSNIQIYNISLVWIEENSTGAFVNHSMTLESGDKKSGIWNYTLSFSNLGTIAFKIYANNTKGDVENTSLYYIHVQDISLSLNLDKTILNPEENLTISGQALLLPDNTPVANNSISIWLDGSLLIGCPNQDPNDACWNLSKQGWKYRKPILISNQAGNLTDYQVKIEINLSQEFSEGKIQQYCQDIRFTYLNQTSGEEQKIPYWIEQCNLTNNDTAIFWIKVPFLQNNTSTTVYLYYGNPSAESESDGEATFVFFDDFVIIKPLENAPTYQTTPTYDGSGQSVHPDVIYFPDGWHGYKYWMVMTPYPNGDASKENPSILVSNDGSSWEVPPGLTNPIDPTPASGHNCDPDMIYNNDTDELWVYYVEDGAGTSYLKRKKSSDGVNWSGEEDIFSLPDYQILSPAIVKVGSTYHIWYVDAGSEGCGASSTTVKYRTSSDGVNWSSAQDVNISQPGYVIWHLNVIYVPSKGEYWMLFAAYPSGSSCDNTVLFFAKSTDGINWTTYNNIALNKGSGWDGVQIYRSALLYNESNNLLRVWYSAKGDSAWHIGYTERNYTDFLNDLSKTQENKWITYQGTSSISDELYHSAPKALKIPGGGNKVKSTFVFSNQSVVVRFWMAVASTSGKAYCTIKDPDDLDPYATNIKFDGGTLYYLCDAGYVSSGKSYTANEWHQIKFILKPSVSKFDVYIDDMENPVATNKSWYKGSGLSTCRITPEGDPAVPVDLYVDDFIVRKYASPEPSVATIGAEQAITSTDSQGNYSYTFKASLEAGTYEIKVNLTDPNGIYGENQTTFYVRGNLEILTEGNITYENPLVIQVNETGELENITNVTLRIFNQSLNQEWNIQCYNLSSQGKPNLWNCSWDTGDVKPNTWYQIYAFGFNNQSKNIGFDDGKILLVVEINVSQLFPENNSYLNYSSVSFKCMAKSSGGNVDCIALYINGSLANQTCNLNSDNVTLTFNQSLGEGNYQWYCWANLSGMSYGESSPVRNLTIDLTLPGVWFESETPENNSYLSQSYILVNLSASDLHLNFSKVELYNESLALINQTVCFSQNCKANFSGLEDGIYYIKGRARDKANNENQTELRKVTLDTVKPGIGSLSYRQEVNLSELFWVKVRVSDENLERVYIEENSTGIFKERNLSLVEEEWETNFSVNRKGSFWFRVRAKDKAGNENATGYFEVKVYDKVNVEIIEAPAGDKDRGIFNISCRVYNLTNTSIANYSVKILDNGDLLYQNYTNSSGILRYSWDAREVLVGEHVIVCKIEDDLGNYYKVNISEENSTVYLWGYIYANISLNPKPPGPVDRNKNGYHSQNISFSIYNIRDEQGKAITGIEIKTFKDEFENLSNLEIAENLSTCEGRLELTKEWKENSSLEKIENLSWEEGRLKIKSIPWLFENWSKRMKIRVNSSKELENFQVRLEIPFREGMQSDYSDLRFSWVNESIGCFDQETLVLTSKGWKYFGELEGDELILTLNSKTGQKEWQEVREIFGYDYEGEMFEIELENGDKLLVSPEHRIYSFFLFSKSFQRSSNFDFSSENSFFNSSRLETFSSNLPISTKIPTETNKLNSSNSGECTNPKTISNKNKIPTIIKDKPTILNTISTFLSIFSQPLEYIANPTKAPIPTLIGTAISNPTLNQKYSNKVKNNATAIPPNVAKFSLETINSYSKNIYKNFSLPPHFLIKYVINPARTPVTTPAKVLSSILIPAKKYNPKATVTNTTIPIRVERSSLDIIKIDGKDYIKSISLEKNNYEKEEGYNKEADCSGRKEGLGKQASKNDFGRGVLERGRTYLKRNGKEIFKEKEIGLVKISEFYQGFKEGKVEGYFLTGEGDLVRIKAIRKVPYSGKIWDVDVGNDIILVKREGSKGAYWSGNSNPSSKEEEIPYWIESYNSTRAIVWVKIPKIDNSTVIYCYYNNSLAESKSNASQVFDFFIDGEDAGNWVNGTTLVSNDGGRLRFEEAYADNSRAYRSFVNPLNSSYYSLDLRLMVNNTANTDQFSLYFDDGGTANRIAVVYIPKDSAQNEVKALVGSNYYTLTTNFSFDNYYILSLKINESSKNVSYYLFDEFYSLLGKAENLGYSYGSPSSLNRFDFGSGFDNAQLLAWIDWIRIRKASDSNIETSLEEVQNRTKFGYAESILIIPDNLTSWNNLNANFSLNNGTLVFKVIDGSSLEVVKECSASCSLQDVKAKSLKIRIEFNASSLKEGPELYSWNITWFERRVREGFGISKVIKTNANITNITVEYSLETPSNASASIYISPNNGTLWQKVNFSGQSFSYDYNLSYREIRYKIEFNSGDQFSPRLDWIKITYRTENREVPINVSVRWSGTEVLMNKAEGSFDIPDDNSLGQSDDVVEILLSKDYYHNFTWASDDYEVHGQIDPYNSTVSFYPSGNYIINYDDPTRPGPDIHLTGKDIRDWLGKGLTEGTDYQINLSESSASGYLAGTHLIVYAKAEGLGNYCGNITLNHSYWVHGKIQSLEVNWSIEVNIITRYPSQIRPLVNSTVITNLG